MIDVNDFNQEKDCIYKEEHYSVRDNGAIFRHQRDGKRKRPNDEKGTFGKENNDNPYLIFSNNRVHRIVATAFQGDPPDPKYVVDHIDSNCRNNRPENLRWLSRLENTLNNPVTRKKIEYLCGSIESFLENPSMLNALQGNPNFTWMRTVTPEEAQNCLQRMSLWAKTKNKTSKSTNTINYRKSFEKRALIPLQKWEAGFAGTPELDFASTPWCGRYAWREDAYFPCCPNIFSDDPLNDYYQNLKKGAVFAYNDEDAFPKLTVFKTEMINNKSSILLMCKRSDSNWSIAGIELNMKFHFIHYYFGSYTDKIEADKAFLDNMETGDFGKGAYYNSWVPK